MNLIDKKQVRKLLFNNKNFYYPEGVLEYSGYIEADLHLTGQGNNKLANFTYEQFAH